MVCDLDFQEASLGFQTALLGKGDVLFPDDLWDFFWWSKLYTIHLFRGRRGVVCSYASKIDIWVTRICLTHQVLAVLVKSTTTIVVNAPNDGRSYSAKFFNNDSRSVSVVYHSQTDCFTQNTSLRSLQRSRTKFAKRSDSNFHDSIHFKSYQ